jgi:hypothetical protein
MKPVEGQKTKFYTDVKIDIIAGMQFGTNDNKLRKVGYEVIRQYFDSAEKDWQIGRQVIKRVMTY